MRYCSVEGCNNKHRGNGWCDKHLMQMRRHGKILKRTIFDPNEIIIEGCICRMKLYNKKGEEVAETIFDLEDYEKVKEHKWGLSHQYVVTTPSIRGKSLIYLANFIINIPKGLLPDHINRNTLDNRKENLRTATHSQNLSNKAIRKNTLSGYVGVCFLKHVKNNPWLSRVHFNKKCHYVGRFASPKEAAYARDQKAKELHGEFAVLNGVNL